MKQNIFFWRKSKMNASTLQVAIFFNDMILRPDILAEKFNEGFGGIFDATPIVSPVPTGAPQEPFAEFPIVQRTSSQSPHRFNVAAKRCDLIIAPPTNLSMDSERFLALHKSLIEVCIKTACENFNSINRIGIIYSINEITTTPVADYARKYFKEADFNTNEFAFRINAPTTVGALSINRNKTISSSFVIGATSENVGKIQPLYTIQCDINTVASPGLILSEKDLESVLNYALNQFTENKMRELI